MFFSKLKEKLTAFFEDQTKLATALMIAAVVIAAVSVLVMALSGIDIKGASGNTPAGKTQNEEAAPEDETQEAVPEGNNGEGADDRENGAEGEAPEENGTSEPEQSTEPDTETEQGPDKGLVHTISPAELEVIRQKYDGTVRGFGIGLEGGSRDTYNRQLQAVNINSTLKSLGANVLVFASEPDTPNAAIAFQAGYEAGYTEQVLDILKQYDVKATFFVTMEYVSKNPDIVKRMIDEGHEIGSHSSSCPEDGIANYALSDQMNDAMELQNFMEAHYDYTMTKYNFNSGVYSVQQAILMSKMGYEFTFCSLNYADYDPDESFNSADVLSKLEDMMHNGCIYCFHMTNKVTVEILPGLIQCMKDEGYNIVSLR